MYRSHPNVVIFLRVVFRPFLRFQCSIDTLKDYFYRIIRYGASLFNNAHLLTYEVCRCIFVLLTYTVLGTSLKDVHFK